MQYFIHPDGRRTVCESDSSAQRTLARGFESVRYAVYRAAWQRQDERILARWRPLRGVCDAPEQERTV